VRGRERAPRQDSKRTGNLEIIVGKPNDRFKDKVDGAGRKLWSFDGRICSIEKKRRRGTGDEQGRKTLMSGELVLW
jgi:hypothetical protein